MAREPISRDLRFQIFDRDGFRCVYCGAEAPDATLHVDHVQAVTKGGDNDPNNLVTACSACNLGKRNRELEAAIPALPPPPPRPAAAWFRHATGAEQSDYMGLRREAQLLEASISNLVAERRKIMARCIRRMRRAEGKE